MAQSPSVVRPPAVKPSHHDQAKSLPSDSWNVAFRHPGYDDPNVLLQMPAIDPGGGVHHATALVACAIMADSQWDGYFTEDKEGQRKVDVSLDDILKGRNYYFHLPNTTSCEYYCALVVVSIYTKVDLILFLFQANILLFLRSTTTDSLMAISQITGGVVSYQKPKMRKSHVPELDICSVVINPAGSHYTHRSLKLRI